MDIARVGYERRSFPTEQHYNWAFFPLFPLILRLASLLTGEHALTGRALFTIFFFGALVLLHKLVLAFGFDAPDADRTIFYLAVFPVSYFFYPAND